MRIYKPKASEGFEGIYPSRAKDADLLKFDGRARGPEWEPVVFDWVTDEKGWTFLPSDFPWYLSSVLVLKENSLPGLRDLLEANGELLPAASEDGEKIWVFNSQVVDALDVQESVLVRYPSSGRIMAIKKYEFFWDMVQSVDLFRVKGYTGSPTFVSERFVRRVSEFGLKGMEFEVVWSG